MSFTLTMSNVIVGRSELENRDPARRIAAGVFRPGLGYDLAQPVFDLYDGAAGDPAALARYRHARDALRLALASASGATVVVRELRVRRAGDASATSLILEIETDDAAFWASGSSTNR